jgi:hypothetical protein
MKAIDHLSNRGAFGTPLLCMLLASILSAPALAQPVKSSYSVAAVTQDDTTNHLWPSLNDNGVIVWSQQVAGACGPCAAGWNKYPCVQGLCWQVFKCTTAPSCSGSSATQITFDAHNHVFSAIDNNLDITAVRLKVK